MDHIKITFRNGEVFEPNTRAEFREGSRSRDIDLPAGPLHQESGVLLSCRQPAR